VLVSSHAVADLEGLAARICVLRDGEVVADAAPGVLMERANVDRLEDAVVKLLEAEAS
jgi:ABC-type Na+ transport system ATPase subunit NatA